MIALAVAVVSSRPLVAQGRSLLPPSRADTLISDGRWSEAEALLYEQSQRDPRAPIPRAAFGRYLGMKGAVRIAVVLIDEALQFGLDSIAATELSAPFRAVRSWRNSSIELRGDSSIIVQAPADPRALFRIPYPRAVPGSRTAPSAVVWYDVVDRPIGLDSIRAALPAVGLELLEALVPSLDLRDSTLTLHANPRSALLAYGRRYQILRSSRGIQVLMDERRTLPIADALRELAPKWWQIDVPHGVLVVR